MNRKQRRSGGRFGPAPAGGPPASATAAHLFAAAAGQHQAGAYAEAERRYRYILSLFPDHADSLNNLGLLMLHGGNPSSAAELIGKAIKLDDRVAQYHYNISLAWRALDRMDQVAAHLERAAELRPDQGLTFLNLGNVRRQQGRLADAMSCYERAQSLLSNSAVAGVSLADVLSELGRWDDASAAYRRALAAEPNNAETHHRFGRALLAQGKGREAVAQFKDAVALGPNVSAVYEGLGTALLSVGEIDSAIDAVVRGLELGETQHGQALFAHCVKSVRFTAKNDRLCRLVFRALTEGWSRPRDLDNVCISIVKLNPVVRDCIARAVAARPIRLDAAELFGDGGLAALAADELLAALLRCDPIPDTSLECLLANVRAVMLEEATGRGEAIADRDLSFYAAVARQCFINEYIYALGDGEDERVRNLQARL
ncbi:MAG: tetratricopeptide repeat protein, partial [Xanthobacteraceae bacterium]